MIRNRAHAIGGFRAELRGSNRYVERRVTRARDESDRSAVEPARRRLEFIDDLHRSDFRRASDRTRRKCRREQFKPIDLWREARADFRDTVMHSDMRFEDARGRHFHRTDFRDAAEVVPHQVDDHREFGGVFVALKEFARIGRGRARALDWSRDDGSIREDAKETLGAHRNELAVVGKIDRGAEPSVVRADRRLRKSTRAATEFRRKAARDVRLERIARADVLNGACDIGGKSSVAWLA